MSLKPMKIQIPENEVAYLRLRLKQTRWPPRVDSSGWAAGTDADYLRALAAYWASQYSWREREARLNRFNHFIAEVSGTNIDFIKAAGQGPNPVP